MKRRSLAFKLISGGVLVVLVPLAVVGVISVMNASEAIESLAGGQAGNIANNLAALVQNVLSQEMKLASEMSVNPSVVVTAAKATSQGAAAAAVEIRVLDDVLHKAAKKMGKDYEAVLVTDGKGMVIADSQQGKNKGMSLANREYFQIAREGKPNISPPVKSKLTGKPIVVVAAPIQGLDGGFVGVVANLLKTDDLSQKVTSTKVGSTGYPWMVDKTGLVVAHPVEKHILNTNLAKSPGMEEIMRQMLAGRSGVGTYVFQGLHKIAGYAPVPLTGWAVGFTQNTDEFMAPVYRIRNLTIIVGVIALVLTVIGVFLFSRGITRPINRAVGQLHDGSDQVAAASSQVANAGQSLAEGTSELAASIEETSASLEELTAMTKQNTENANQADSLMKEVSSMVSSASQSMVEMSKSMKEISAAGQEINNIIKSIDEVAFQTNLLALNAAVEAARAGEAGAGFAVVAGEVRNLAMRAAEAAQNTATLIETTIQKINHGAELVKRVDEAFGQVSANASKVADIVSEITAASNEQSQGITQINQAVTDMDKVTQSTAANAEESAASAEELSAQAEDIRGVVEDLLSVIGAARVDRALASKTPKKKTKPKALPAPRKASLEAQRQAIPLDDGDFKDF